MEERDVVVIGGGPAGYAAAIRAAQLGGRVALVEKDKLGGTCLNRGCIPTSVFARAVEFLEMGAQSKDYGILFKEQSIDFSKLAARKDVVVKTLIGGVGMLLREHGVEMEQGSAAFLLPGEVSLTLTSGEKKVIKARNVVVATGGRCRQLPIPGGGMVLDAGAALESKEAPISVILLGAGFIGMALATIFSKLGAYVAVVEKSEFMLPGIDREIVALYEKEARKGKIAYYPRCTVRAIEEGPDGQRRVRAEADGQEIVLDAQLVFNTEEREANIGELGLDRFGLKLNGKGGIAVDGAMKTSVPGVFAAGDATMEHMWTEAAYMEGVVAAENAMGGQSRINYSAMPYWTCTIPRVAGVGLTEEEAVKKDYETKVARYFLAANGMAVAIGQRTGMLKLITERKYGQILGVHMVGAQATELIGEASLAVRLEQTCRDVGDAMHVHPSVSEALWEAARSIGGDSIHLIPGR